MENNVMTEEFDMEQIMAQSQSATPGSVVDGTVVSQSESHLLVNVGLKQEAGIALSEFLGEIPKVGDVIPVVVLRTSGPEGRPVASWKMARERKYWDVVAASFEKKETIEGKITRRVKGGVIVDVGLDAFMPASQIDLKQVGDPTKWIGQSVKVVILEMDRAKGNVLVSRRRILEQELAVKRTETLGALQVGQVVKGRVTGLTNFGAFVDIGGIEGLLHVTDLSWARVDNPQSVVKVGQELEVKVLKHDAATHRISLGLKQLMKHPWEGIEAKYPAGTLVKGKVSSIAPFGVFVELEPGVEGLIHVSELMWTERVKDPKKVAKVGQEVEARVLNIDREKEKISLSLKRVGTNPWEEAKKNNKPGSIIEGEVTHLANFGAFVKLASGLEALIRNQDVSWSDHNANVSSVLKPGDKVKAVVLDVNVAEEKMALGLKQLTPDPMSAVKVGSTVNGTVSKVTEFGVFVKLESGVEGLVRSNELEGGNPKGSKFSDMPTTPAVVYKEGDQVTASVIKFNKKDRKIELSIRRYERDQERELLKKYSGKQQKTTLGDATGWNQ
jgi:small subunit ribosomal protein S1